MSTPSTSSRQRSGQVGGYTVVGPTSNQLNRQISDITCLVLVTTTPCDACMPENGWTLSCLLAYGGLCRCPDCNWCCCCCRCCYAVIYMLLIPLYCNYCGCCHFVYCLVAAILPLLLCRHCWWSAALTLPQGITMLMPIVILVRCYTAAALMSLLVQILSI
jgi:hypothetical protein